MSSSSWMSKHSWTCSNILQTKRTPSNSKLNLTMVKSRSSIPTFPTSPSKQLRWKKPENEIFQEPVLLFLSLRNLFKIIQSGISARFSLDFDRHIRKCVNQWKSSSQRSCFLRLRGWDDFHRDFLCCWHLPCVCLNFWILNPAWRNDCLFDSIRLLLVNLLLFLL